MGRWIRSEQQRMKVGLGGRLPTVLCGTPGAVTWWTRRPCGDSGGAERGWFDKQQTFREERNENFPFVGLEREFLFQRYCWRMMSPTKGKFHLNQSPAIFSTAPANKMDFI